MSLPAIFRSFDEKENKKRKKGASTDDNHRCLVCGKIFGILHCQKVGNALDVREAKRRHTVGEHAAVDDSQNQPKTGNHQTTKRPSAYKIYKRKRYKYDQRIIEKSKRMSGDKTARLEKGMAANPFHCEADSHGKENVKYQGIFV